MTLFNWHNQVARNSEVFFCEFVLNLSCFGVLSHHRKAVKFAFAICLNMMNKFVFTLYKPVIRLAILIILRLLLLTISFLRLLLFGLNIHIVYFRVCQCFNFVKIKIFSQMRRTQNIFPSV